MKARTRRIVVVALSLALVALAHALMRPAPLPALTGVAGGLALWLAQPRAGWSSRVGAVLIGALVGVGPHLVTHLRGRSPEPAEGLVRHLAVDGLLGLLLALTILVVAVGLPWLRRYARAR